MSNRPAAPKKRKEWYFGGAPDVPKIVDLEMQLIEPNPNQPRKTFNEESLAELANSIQRHGLMQPITVKRKDTQGNAYILVAGERRFRAHQILNKNTIHSIILTDGDLDELALIENVQREDLNPLEEASALARLMEIHNYTQEQLGQVIGKSQTNISAVLRLNTLPERIRNDDYVTSSSVTKSVLLEIAREKDQKKQLQLWEALKDGHINVRTARQVKKRQQAKPDTAESKLKNLLLTGKRFTKELAKIPAANITANQENLKKIRELRDELNEIINRTET